MIKWLKPNPKKTGMYSVKIENYQGKLINRKMYFDGKGYKYSADSKKYTGMKVHYYLSRQEKETKLTNKSKCPNCDKQTLKIMEHCVICTECDYIRGEF